jgi:hypothetical protein
MQIILPSHILWPPSPRPWTACICLHSRFHSDTTNSSTTTTNAIHTHILTTTQGTCGGSFIWMSKGLATLCSYDGEWAIVCRDIDRRLEILNCSQLDLDDEICWTRILPGLVRRPFQSMKALQFIALILALKSPLSCIQIKRNLCRGASTSPPLITVTPRTRCRWWARSLSGFV